MDINALLQERWSDFLNKLQTKERGNPRATPPRLLHPTSLRQALEDVSTDHVNQGINNEWPWLHGVKERIAKNRLAPWKRRELQDLLNEDWDAPWGQQEDKSIIPTCPKCERAYRLLGGAGCISRAR